MEFELWRYNGGVTATLGIFFDHHEGTRRLLCFTCEDEYRVKKVAGETRFPPGRYRILLRTEGGMHQKYAFKYGAKHKGMLWLQDVPGFEWVYLHVGNTEAETDGCPLLGETRDESRRTVHGSRKAYESVYPVMADAIESGVQVWLTVVDLDRPVLPDPPDLYLDPLGH